MVPGAHSCDIAITDGVVRISGEITAHDGSEFEKAVSTVLGANDGEALLDLSAVTYIDSFCVHILAQAFTSANEKGIRLSVVVGDQAMRLLTAAGIDALGDIRLAGEEAPGSS